MYQALYRKYRPKSFNDVVGQKAVIQILKNSIKQNKINHAYLFYGPRGIGKTTIAKILSRAINCEKTIDGNPCNQCDLCEKSVDSIDIIEIDAASNNGVDEIREIRNKVNLVPTELNYKIYIIDEVHMLTTGAFNALLKTLEEPPKHVIFILATTDLQKVSETIISRCQCFSFKKISVDENISKLKEICKNEKIEVSDEVLKLIAEYSDGGLRDSIGLLDKISSYKTGKIETDDFYELNDMISKTEIEKFKNNIINLKYNEVIEKIKKYNDSGKNLIEIVMELLYNLRNSLIEYYETGKKNENIELMIDLANTINEKMFDIKKSNNPRIYIEMILLNFIHKHENFKKIDQNSEKNYFPGNNLKEKENIQKIEKKQLKTNVDEIINVRINNILATASKQEKSEEISNIEKLKKYVFDQKYGSIVSELLNGKVCASGNIGTILSFEYESVVEKNKKQLSLINKIYNKLLNNDKKLAIVGTTEWQNITKEYINNKKNGKEYGIIEEPPLIEDITDSEKNRIEIDVMDAFKEIIEVE